MTAITFARAVRHGPSKLACDAKSLPVFDGRAESMFNDREVTSGIIGDVPNRTATRVEFSAEPSVIDATTVIRLPPEASAALPSRGQVAVEGSINGRSFRTVVEPDGRRGHWLRLDPAHADVVAVEVVLEPTVQWPEPVVPADLGAALAAASQDIRDVWDDITPMARWEWVRWVGATANAATRQRRVDVTISKIEHGKRRPCCFDLSACTDPGVARNGKLRDAT